MATYKLTVRRLRDQLADVDGDLFIETNDSTIVAGYYDDDDEFIPEAWQPLTGNRYEDLNILVFEELDG